MMISKSVEGKSGIKVGLQTGTPVLSDHPTKLHIFTLTGNHHENALRAPARPFPLAQG